MRAIKIHLKLLWLSYQVACWFLPAVMNICSNNHIRTTECHAFLLYYLYVMIPLIVVLPLSFRIY